MGHFLNSGPRCEQVLKLKNLFWLMPSSPQILKKKTILKLFPSSQGNVKFELSQSYEKQIETAPK